jgi:hypothetical protein
MKHFTLEQIAYLLFILLYSASTNIQRCLPAWKLQLFEIMGLVAYRLNTDELSETQGSTDNLNITTLIIIDLAQ